MATLPLWLLDWTWILFITKNCPPKKNIAMHIIPSRTPNDGMLQFSSIIPPKQDRKNEKNDAYVSIARGGTWCVTTFNTTEPKALKTACNIQRMPPISLE